MVENKLDFVPVVPETVDALCFVFSKNILPKAKEEFDIMYPGNAPVYKKVIKAVKTLQDAFFVMVGGDMLGIIGRKKITENGVTISLLFASTTEYIKKYVKQYVIASKKFISNMSKDSDILVFSLPEDFDRSRAIIRKLGFTKISIDEVKGRKIVTKILRCEHGMDK